MTSDTNFSNIIVTNNYPCLAASIWTATFNADGNTVYSNKPVSAKRPIHLVSMRAIQSDTIINEATITDLSNPTILSDRAIQNSLIANSNIDKQSKKILQNSNSISEIYYNLFDRKISDNICYSNIITYSNYNPSMLTDNPTMMAINNDPANMFSHMKLIWNNLYYETHSIYTNNQIYIYYLFLKNKFDPAYILVNNAPIFHNCPVTKNQLHYIKANKYSVINADGISKENCLDTRNHHSSDQSQHIENAGLKHIPKTTNTTDDSDLHLVTDQGRTLIATSNNKEKFIFRISSNIKYVRLVSRTSKPNDTTEPLNGNGEHRALGVLVANITLIERKQLYRINSHLTCSHTKGWDEETSTLYRWTTGDAILELPERKEDAIGMLVIDVIAGGPYPLDEVSETSK